MTEVEIDKKPVTTNAARNYVIVVVATAALLASVLATVAWRVGPPTGDLARIAGASERLFGWQDEVAGFKEDAYDLVSKDELLAGKSPGDILIFGDSFSVKHVGGVSWINTIVALTGLTANVVQIQDFHPVVNYLRSQAYREAPPKAIIVQSVERALLPRAMGAYNAALPCAASQPAPQTAALQKVTFSPAMKIFTRRKNYEGIDEMLTRGALSIRLGLLGVDNVIEVTLSRSDLFTNAAKSRVLLYGDDVRNYLPEKLPLHRLDEYVDKAVCGLRQLVSMAEQRTPVFLVVAPDKRSVYAPWIATPLPGKPVDLFALATEALGPLAINVRKPLMSAAKVGNRRYLR